MDSRNDSPIELGALFSTPQMRSGKPPFNKTGLTGRLCSILFADPDGALLADATGPEAVEV